MSQAPNLLNDDGTASIATALMSSHHAFRRDLARFALALAQVENGDTSRIEPVRAEWKNFHAALHGHHEAEDHGILPDIANKHAAVRATVERLSADHRRIDPLLARGDAALDLLPDTASAVALLHELGELLHPHLATEEREIVPFLRDMKAFPPLPNDDAAAMYADGFAWSTHGLAPDVIEKNQRHAPRERARASARGPRCVCRPLRARLGYRESRRHAYAHSRRHRRLTTTSDGSKRGRQLQQPSGSPRSSRTSVQSRSVTW
jgi:hypothetical protein